MDPLLGHFGKRKLDSIGQADVDAAALALYPKAKLSTRDRQVYAPMSAVLRHGAKREWCAFRVLERPEYNNARVRWIYPGQAEALVANAPAHLKPILIFLFGTGARLSEAIYLQWVNVDLSRAHVTFENTKNGESRGVPLSERVVASLTALPNRVGPVFLTHKGLPYRPRHDCGGQIRSALAKACTRASIENFHAHDCRHTWATWHYAANRDIHALMNLGGWKSHEMVLRYAHVNVENLRDGIKAMGW
ncbi:MAG: site-specific integrase [Aestuariivirga sp.]|nr:site-specific integrase [Aestuariivirga sp.]